MVKDYKRKTCLPIDMLKPTDNISIKEYYRMNKYKDLKIEI